MMAPEDIFEIAVEVIVERCDVQRLPFDPRNVSIIHGCKVANKDHAEVERYYAHTFHRKNAICTCDAFEELNPEHQFGILLHEFGHLYGGESEAEADLWVEEALGIEIDYVNMVQWVDLLDLNG